MQRQPAFLSDAVSNGAFELRVQRQHGAENFADRGEIIIGNPTAKTQQLIVEHRRNVEDAENSFCLDRRFAIVEFNHDSRHALLAESYEHAAADHRSGFCTDTVGKNHVERHGQGNVAELGH